MSKKEKYYIEIRKVIENFFDKNNKRIVSNFLILNSNLPGRRANIELANVFADITADFIEEFSNELWDLCLFLISFAPDKAPTNDPREFLPFCGIWAIGAIGASNSEYYENSLIILKKLSNDPRWRIREAIAFGFQKLLMKHPYKVLAEFEKWIDEKDWLTLRAIVAGIAHPSVLINNKISEIGLEVHKAIFSKIILSNDFSSEEFKILKRGLSYTLSVIIYANPEKGFKFLSQYINVDNTHIRGIIRENLKKNRLSKNFPKEVNSLYLKFKF